MADDLNSSAHVWGDGTPRGPQSQSQSTPTLIDTQPTEEPPSYTNATSTSAATPPRPQRPATPPRQRYNPLEALSLLSSIRFAGYTIPTSTLDQKRAIVTTTYAPFYSSTASLSKLLAEQINLPPRPLLRIKGTHVDSGGRSIVDFDLVLNLTTLLDLQPQPQSQSSDPSTSSSSSSTPQSSGRLHFKELPIDTPSPPTQTGSRLFRREKGPPAPTPPLTKWITKFITDKSENKSFHLTRVLPHAVPLQQSLEGSIRTLLHTLQYRGKVDVTCPLQYEGVVISKKPSNWFVSMLNLHPEKKYDVVESYFQWRGHREMGAREEGGEEPTAREVREHLKAAEANARSLAEEWWRDWRDVVRNGALRGWKGRLGVEEWIEVSMGRRIPEKGRDWGADGSWEGSGPIAFPAKWAEDDL